MPLADFKCPRCGTIREDVYFRAQDGARSLRLTCEAPHCCAYRLEWIPQVGAIDAKEPFQQTTVWRDVYDKNPQTGDMERHQRQEVVGSLHQMRKIEADSEQRFRNGEGEPLRFRMLSQNASNKEVGSFGTAGQIGQQKYDSGNPPVQKSGRVQVTRHGTRKPQRAVARGGGFTPLKER